MGIYSQCFTVTGDTPAVLHTYTKLTLATDMLASIADFFNTELATTNLTTSLSMTPNHTYLVSNRTAHFTTYFTMLGTA